jgi:copper chaperone for superoxide dismutase
LRGRVDEIELTARPRLQTVFAVPLKCGACVKHVSDTLYGIGSITKVEAKLEDQLVLVEGTGA